MRWFRSIQVLLEAKEGLESQAGKELTIPVYHGVKFIRLPLFGFSDCPSEQTIVSVDEDSAILKRFDHLKFQKALDFHS